MKEKASFLLRKHEKRQSVLRFASAENSETCPSRSIVKCIDSGARVLGFKSPSAVRGSALLRSYFTLFGPLCPRP